MRPLWVDRILGEPVLRSDLFAFFDERRKTWQQHVLDAVRKDDFHGATLATGRVEGMDILRREIAKYDKEDSHAKLYKKEKGGKENARSSY